MVISLDSPFDRPIDRTWRAAAYAADAPIVSPASRATPGRLRKEGGSAGWGGEMARGGRRRDGAPVIRRLGAERRNERSVRPLDDDARRGILAQHTPQLVVHRQ